MSTEAETPRSNSAPEDRNLAQLSVQELIALARAEQLVLGPEDEETWRPIYELGRRPGREVLDAGLKLTQSTDATCRQLGARFLAQRRDFADQAEEAQAELVRLLETDTSTEVLHGAAAALTHLSPWQRDDYRPLPVLLRLARHGDELVRYGSVFALLTCEHPEAVAMLIERSRDLDEDVRNWATFGLGSQINLDTPAIREALWVQIDEEDEEIRGEALTGLAHRKVPGVHQAIVRELQRPCVHGTTFEAAGLLADPAFVPLLESWRESDGPPHDLWLEDAIRACTPAAAIDVRVAVARGGASSSSPSGASTVP